MCQGAKRIKMTQHGTDSGFCMKLHTFFCQLPSPRLTPKPTPRPMPWPTQGPTPRQTPLVSLQDPAELIIRCPDDMLLMPTAPVMPKPTPQPTPAPAMPQAFPATCPCSSDAKTHAEAYPCSNAPLSQPTPHLTPLPTPGPTPDLATNSIEATLVPPAKPTPSTNRIEPTMAPSTKPTPIGLEPMLPPYDAKKEHDEKSLMEEIMSYFT